MRGLVTAVALCAWAASAHAGVRLDYERADDRCPDREQWVGLVAERLGGDPLEADAALHVSVTLAPRRAQIRILEAGRVVGSRTLRASAADCAELARAAALAVAIAIDPSLAFRPRARVAAAPSPVATRSRMPARAATTIPAAVALPPRDQERPAAVPTDLYVGAGLVAAVGASPQAGAGATVQIGVRRGRASLAVEGRLDQSAGVEFGPGTVHASLRFGALVPCLHRGALAACGVVAAGALHGRPVGFEMQADQASVYLGAGARFAYEREITGGLAARLHADVLGAVVRTELTVSEMPVWTMPPWSAAMGIAAVGYFP